MVETIVGAGLGLERSSARELEGFGGGASGNSPLGRNGERAVVNAATGNLVVTRQDSILIGDGLDAVAARTYNSQGLLTDDNGDNWLLSPSRKLFGLSGAIGSSGSTIKLQDWDGSSETFTWDATLAAYVSTEGAGAYDTLSYDSVSQTWTLIDGSSQQTQAFDAANGGRIVSASDSQGRVLSYFYNTNGYISEIRTANGDSTFYDYDTVHTARPTQIRESYKNESNAVVSQISTRYAYDAQGRLSGVTVDLTPEDSSITDGAVYQTNYAYDANGRLASVTQTDGSETLITYDTGGRVATLSRLIDGGVYRTTTYTYLSGETLVTDALGQVTTYKFDAQQRLTQIIAPAVASGVPTWTFAYNANGDVTSTTDSNGSTTIYEYDAAGNLTLSRDTLGNTLRRTYGSRNELLTETRYVVADPDGAGTGQPSGGLTTRYVYDSELNLRYVVTAEGRVHENVYWDDKLGMSLDYASATYDVSALGETPLALWQLDDWSNAISDKSAGSRVDYSYDVRGQLRFKVTYAQLDANGDGVSGGATRQELYCYDHFGRLFWVQTDATAAGGDWHGYDGLGRRYISVDANNVTTYAFFDDAGATTSITANGLTQTSVYNRAGDLIAFVENNGATVLSSSSYAYDAAGRLRYIEDPNGARSYTLYDAAGRKTGGVSADGALTEYLYDQNGRAIGQIAYDTPISSGSLTTLSDTAAAASVGGVRPVASSDDRYSWTVYDAAGRIIETIDSTGAATIFIYDSAGRLTKKTAYSTLLSGGQLSGFQSAGFATYTVPPADANTDRTTRYFYDGDGLLVGVLDPEGTLTQTVYDGMGRKIETIAFATQIPANLVGGSWSALLSAAGTASADQHNFYYYDARNLLIASVNGAGEVARFHYNTNNELTQETFGQKLALSGGRPTLAQVEGAAGSNLEMVQYTRSIYGQILTRTRTLTGAASETERFKYDDARRLIETVIGDGTAAARSNLRRYDVQGRLTGELGGDGAAALAALGSNPTQGQVDGIYALYGVNYNYDAAGRLIAKSTPDGLGSSGVQTLYFYDQTGDLRFVINALGEVTEYRYDSFGERTDNIAYSARLSSGSLTGLEGGEVDAGLLSLVGALSNPTLDSRSSATYGLRGQLETQTDAAGRVSTFEYNAFGEQIKRLTPAPQGGATVETATHFDRRGLLISTSIDPTGLDIEISTQYDAFGRVVSSFDARGVETRYTYDNADHLLTRTQDPGAGHLALVTTYAYDNRGELVQTTDPDGRVVQLKYDAAGRQTEQVVDPSGLNLKTQYAYDAAGNLVSKTDAAGSLVARTTTYEYDVAGRRVAEHLDPTGLNITTSYTYDSAGRVAVRMDALGGITRFVYDSQDRLIYQVDPLGAVVRSDYDAQGYMIARTAFTAPISLSGLGQIASVTDIVSRLSTSAGDQTTRHIFNVDGRLRFTIDASNQVVEYAYDAAGGAARKTVYASAITPPAEWTASAVSAAISAHAGDQVSRSFADAAGRLVFAVDAAGSVTQFVRDANGRATKEIAYATISGFTNASTLANVQSWASGQSANVGNRVTRHYFDAAGREIYSVDAESYVDRLIYDNAGRVTKTIRYAAASAVTDSTTIAQLPNGEPSDSVVQQYAYDTAGRLIESTNGGGVKTRLTLDAIGQITDTTEAYGTTDASITHRVFDAAGRLVEEHKGYGAPEVAVTAYDYDSMGRVLEVTNPRGYVTEYSYDAIGRVLTESVALSAAVSAITTKHYDAFGNVTQLVDPRGYSGFFYYDALNRLRLQIDPEGYATATDYTVTGKTKSVTRYATKTSGASASIAPSLTSAAGDATTAFVYDKLDRLVTSTDAVGYAETFSYNAFGDQVSRTNKLGGVTNQTFDKNGNLLSETHVAISVTNTFAYDSRGNRTQSVEASGRPEERVTNLSYDKLNRMVSRAIVGQTAVSISNSGTSTPVVPQPEIFSYDLRGNLIETRDTSGARTLAFYDALDRKIADISPIGAMTAYGMDKSGNITSKTAYANLVGLPLVAGGTPPTPIQAPLKDRSIFFNYDRNNRQIEKYVSGVIVGERNASSGLYAVTTQEIVTSAKYDAMGNIVEETDARGNLSFNYYDALGRKVASVDAGGYLIAYTLDQNGNVLNETRYAKKLTNPADATSSVSSLKLDAGSDPAQNANNRTTDFTYDKMGRRLTQTRRNVEASTISAAGARTFLPSADATIGFTYNGLGQVLTKTEATGDQTQWVYDLTGRETKLIEESFTDHLGNTVTPTTTTVYNGLGQILTQTIDGLAGGADDRVTTYTYDDAGRVTSEKDAAQFIKNYWYDAAGRVAAVSYTRKKSDNSLVTEASLVGYDSAGRQTWTAMGTLSGGSWSIGDRADYFYNAFGELTQRGLNIGGQSGFALAKEYADYDKLGRVTYTNMGDGVSKAYSYDASGNATAYATSQSADVSGDIRGVDFNTIAGNLVLYSLTLSEYDSRNKLTDTYQPNAQNIGEYASIVRGGLDGQAVTSPFNGGTAAAVVDTTAANATSNIGNPSPVSANSGGTVDVNWAANYSQPTKFLPSIAYPTLTVSGLGGLPKYGSGNYRFRFGSLGAGVSSEQSSSLNTVSLPPPSSSQPIYVTQLSSNGASEITIAVLNMPATYGVSSNSLPAKALQVGALNASTTKLLMFIRAPGSGPYSVISPNAVTNTGGGAVAGWFSTPLAGTPFNGGAPNTSFEVKMYGYNSAGAIVEAQQGTVSINSSGTVSAVFQHNPVGALGDAIVSNGYLVVNEVPVGTQQITMRYRADGSAGAWTEVGMFRGGWGANDLWAYNVSGISGTQEYWLEYKNAAGAIISKAISTDGSATPNRDVRSYGKFAATGNTIPQQLVPYVDNPDLVKFTLPGGPSYKSLKIFYTLAGIEYSFTHTWSQASIANTQYTWDVSALVADKYKIYELTNVRYEARDGNDSMVHAASAGSALVKIGYVRGATPTTTVTLSGSQLPAKVLFQAPPTATKIRLSYRFEVQGAAAANAPYSYVEIPVSDNIAAWDVDAIRDQIPANASRTLEYFYDAFDANNIKLPTTNGESHWRGRVTISKDRYALTDSTTIVGYQINTAASNFLIHRQQNYNAFGEIISEINGNLGRSSAELSANSSVVRMTEYEYNTMGRLVRKKSPETSWTNEAGVTDRARPIEQTFYDLSGRVIGMADANQNETRYLLRAGSGYEGEAPASILKEFRADGGVVTRGLDVFGDVRRITDGEGAITDQEFDNMGRLKKVTRPHGAGGARLQEEYGYDGLGQRTTHKDSVHNGVNLDSGLIERTDFDAQGRIIQTITFGGRPTTYEYTYIDGAGQVLAPHTDFKGYRIVSSADGRSSTTYRDQFGKERFKIDLGGHAYKYQYNNAGQIISQLGDGALGNDSGQNISFTYYANGYVRSITDFGTQVASTFEYDNDGNRTSERYYSTHLGTSRLYYQDARAKYDELGRLINFIDEKADISYKYDLVGNRRNVLSVYKDGLNGASQTQNYWYKYDVMNRFTLTQGSLSNGVIGIGAEGNLIGYDEADRRRTSTSANGAEEYTYNNDGTLTDVFVNGVRRVSRSHDLLGRVVNYTEYQANGATDSYLRNMLYDADNRVIEQTEKTRQSNGSDGALVTTRNYYKAFTSAGGADRGFDGADQGDLVSSYQTTAGSSTTVDLNYFYEYWDDAKQRSIEVQGTNPNNRNAQNGNWRAGSTVFYFDVNGHVRTADVKGGVSKVINYTSDAYGQVMIREETLNGTTMGARHLYYYFNGRRIGEVGNDGPSRVDYAVELAKDRNAKPDYRNFKPVASADFDQNYEPISESYPGMAAGSYTVRENDTLRSIATALWGDSSLWYMIADANGLTGTETLVAGRTLIIPNKVTNIHNNATTFRPYNPGEAIGDTMPIMPPEPAAPPPPKAKKKGCGVIGQIIAVVIAVVVFAVTKDLNLAAGIFKGASATTVAVASGAIAGAAGSVASQGFLMATGAQSKFDWGGLAISAISGGVSGGLEAKGIFSGDTFSQGLKRGVTANVITQGISVATGVQSRFDWTGVAVAGVIGGLGGLARDLQFHKDVPTAFGRATEGWRGDALLGTANAIAGAATRVAIDGGDFGDALERAIPDVIGQTIGNLAASRITTTNSQRNGAATNGHEMPGGAERLRGDARYGSAPMDGSYQEYDFEPGVRYHTDESGVRLPVGGRSTPVEVRALPPIPGYEPHYALDAGTREILRQAANGVRWGEKQYARLDSDAQLIAQAAGQVPGYLSGQLLQEYAPDFMNELATISAGGEDALRQWNKGNVEAQIYPQSTADDIAKIAPYALVMLDAATPGGRRTGTVWDSIRATDDVWPGTVLPRSFELDAGNTRIWVAPNASEHIKDYAVGNLNRGVSQGKVDIGVQQELRSLQAAIQTIGPTLPPPRQMVTVDGWELAFSPPREQGQLPALIHAQRIRK